MLLEGSLSSHAGLDYSGKWWLVYSVFSLYIVALLYSLFSLVMKCSVAFKKKKNHIYNIGAKVKGTRIVECKPSNLLQNSLALLQSCLFQMPSSLFFSLPLLAIHIQRSVMNRLTIYKLRGFFYFFYFLFFCYENYRHRNKDWRFKSMNGSSLSLIFSHLVLIALFAIVMGLYQLMIFATLMV